MADLRGEGQGATAPLLDAKKVIFLKKEPIFRKKGVKKWFGPP